jgi:hypothetical protein
LALAGCGSCGSRAPARARAAASIFLLDIFAKGDKENLTRAERNALAQVARRIAMMYGD